MGLVNQTKLLTASSVSQSVLQKGIRLTFSDKGLGIANIGEAMKNGFSTRKSLGLGLPGAKRLVNHFEIGIGLYMKCISHDLT